MGSDVHGIDIVEIEPGVMAGRFLAMACSCEVLAEGVTPGQMAALTRIAADEAWRIEAKWSRYRKGNLVDRLNSANGERVEVDEETARLIDFGEQLYVMSEGRFDLTSGILRRAWRFDANAELPTQASVTTLLNHVGWSRVEWSSPWLRLQAGMEVDFGGLGKEYAVDRALAVVATGADHPVLINFGGDLAASAPRRCGLPWRVGIDSGLSSRATPLVRLRQGAIATSGDANRVLQRDGIRYGHILDARTGWPPPMAPRSVTVAAASCVEAGALATLAILSGAEAEAWLEKLGADANVQRDLQRTHVACA